MSISFSSSCSKYKTYFINGSDPKKPCVDAKDSSKIAIAQRACVVRFANEINKLPFPQDQKNEMCKQLRKDGCGFNYTSPAVLMSLIDVGKYGALAQFVRAKAAEDAAADITSIDSAQ
jgi:hypothetical protein